jgi:ActR/RegA family two-component response regulator
MMSETNNCRLLIIDNDPRWQQGLREVFQRSFLVETAKGSGRNLIADALSKASLFRPHITILDIFLEDGLDRGDRDC